MFSHADALEALQGFIDEGWISEVLFEVKSGKEATVFCCSAGNRMQRHPLIAAKVYRPIETRSFRNDGIYQAGRVHMARDSRYRRAAENKSSFGRKVQYGTWLQNEWETLGVLHRAHADVPEPLSCGERAILMPHFGDETAAAPKLHDAQLSSEHAERVIDRLLWNVELMLDLHRVHGDLSPYNVLLWQEQPVIIDFPQAIDPRLNPAAFPLLSRDIENICAWAARHGVHRNSQRITHDLWSRFVIGEIG